MPVNTSYTATTGSSSPAVIKRQAVQAERKALFTVAEESVQQQTAVPRGEAQVITDAEKNFFEGLFPTAVKDIRAYSPYQRNGVRTDVSLGTLVDVKG